MMPSPASERLSAAFVRPRQATKRDGLPLRALTCTAGRRCPGCPACARAGGGSSRSSRAGRRAVSRFSSCKHRVLVVEVVERLRELEGVPGHVGRLAGGDGALQRGVGLRGGQQQSARSPPTASWRPMRRGVQLAAKSGSCSPRSSSLRRMLRARTAAYCTYGPVSPSKLSASCKSKAITALRVNFSMK